MKINTGHWIVVVTLAGLAAASAVHAKKESNRQIINRWFERIDSKQLDKLGDVEAVDIEMKVPTGPVRGTQGHQQLMKTFATAFPNYKHTVTQCVESGDTIACEGRFAGDNTGPMMTPTGQTMPATNKHVDFEWAGIAKVKDGKVSACHVYFDMMGFMQQLSPPRAP